MGSIQKQAGSVVFHGTLEKQDDIFKQGGLSLRVKSRSWLQLIKKELQKTCSLIRIIDDVI